MKFCSKCGKEIHDEAVVCPGCGCAVEGANQKAKTAEPSTLKTVAWVFMLIGTILAAVVLIPLAWMIPMTLSLKKKMNTGEPVGLGFKICVLLFVNQIAGILLLVDKD